MPRLSTWPPASRPVRRALPHDRRRPARLRSARLGSAQLDSVRLGSARPSSRPSAGQTADSERRTADGGRQAVRSWMQLRRCLWSRSAAPGPAGARFTALCRRRGAEDGDIPPLLAELPCRCLRTPARRGGTKAGLCCRQPARHGTAWHCFRPLRRPCGVHVGTGLGPRGLCSMGAT